jgi:hypothetical protein
VICAWDDVAINNKPAAAMSARYFKSSIVPQPHLIGGKTILQSCALALILRKVPVEIVAPFLPSWLTVSHFGYRRRAGAKPSTKLAPCARSYRRRRRASVQSFKKPPPSASAAVETAKPGGCFAATTR